MKNSLKLSASLVCVILTALCQAGSLTPPAPPTARTMKPLNEIEPRIAMNAQNTPSGSNYMYVISQPGSYYLTANNSSSTLGGILITTGNVKIDLSGYMLECTTLAPGYHGIYISGALKNIAIRNGTLKGFNYGIYADTSNCANIRVSEMNVVNNSNGISLTGTYCQVRDCVVSDNGIAKDTTIFGINVGRGSTVADNTVTGNGASAASGGSSIYGISADDHSTISNNTVQDNGNFAGSDNIYGIYADYECLINNNNSSNNGFATTAYNACIYGIYTRNGCIINNNVSAYNGSSAAGQYTCMWGIYAGSGSSLVGNSTYYNGGDSVGWFSYIYGIYAGVGCSVIGNTAFLNGSYSNSIGYGIYLSAYDLVNNNAAYSNGGTSGGINMNATEGCVFGTNLAP